MTTKTTIFIGALFAIIAVLALLLGGGMLPELTRGNFMMGNGSVAGNWWMLIPASLMLGIFVFIVWAIFVQKK